MIFKWFHNRKYKRNPKCPCGWRMIPSTRKHFHLYWICKFKECTWEAWSSENYRIKFWKTNQG